MASPVNFTYESYLVVDSLAINSTVNNYFSFKTMNEEEDFLVDKLSTVIADNLCCHDHILMRKLLPRIMDRTIRKMAMPSLGFNPGIWSDNPHDQLVSGHGSDSDGDLVDSATFSMEPSSPVKNQKWLNKTSGVMTKVSNWFSLNNRKQSSPVNLGCVFCRNNGQPRSVWSTHHIRDTEGKVSCPILRRYNCPLCKNGGGDYAHTKTHCPLYTGRTGSTNSK